MRSQGEEQIARLLSRTGTRYLYEHPVAVLDQEKVRIWYPDFWLPDYGILIEYFGKTGDADYDAGTSRKMTAYQASGLTALGFGPQLFEGDWPGRVLDRIEGVLVGRLDGLRVARHKSGI